MFGPPEGYVPTETERQMAEEWLPTHKQIAVAVAMLNADPTADHVIVPLALPGKERHVWSLGQTCEPVGGFWLVLNRETRPGEAAYDHGAARNAAEHAARVFLNAHHKDRGGSTSYAVIWRDGHAAVWEGLT